MVVCQICIILSFPDVSDLQNFVNVALATAAGGEDDYANDRLSDLRTVGSGFSSLIYKLREVTGFLGLAQRCSSVWTVLKDNRKLPEMLVHNQIHFGLFNVFLCTCTYAE